MDLENINSIRFYTADPESGKYTENVLGIFYPQETEIPDVMELVPKMNAWINNTSQSMGNWTSRESIQNALAGTGIAEHVPVLKQELSVKELNNAMKKNKDKMKTGLRFMKKKDIPSAVAIIRSHDKFDGRCSKDYYQVYFADQERLTSKQEQNFVAIDPNKESVNGVCGFSPDHYKTPGIKWLSWFYVDAAYRRKGIGAQLLSHTLAHLNKLKTKKVYLDTSSDPKYKHSIEVYQSYGFKIEGDLADYYSKGESMIIMGLALK